MARSFDFLVRTEPAELLRILGEKLEGFPDIHFSGDESAGDISGRGFEGGYTMSKTTEGTAVTLTIRKKPPFIPWMFIQNKLEEAAERW